MDNDENKTTTAMVEISEQRLAANQLNAQKSTGPRTEAAKNKSKMNALKHGLRAKEVVIPALGGCETKADFDSFYNQLCEDRDPQGALEEILVARIAACLWRLNRAVRGETIWMGLVLQSAQKRQDRCVETELVVLISSENIEHNLRYQTTIERQMYRAVTELERLQRQRKGESVPAPIKVELSGQN
jgi:hypothetical protein